MDDEDIEGVEDTLTILEKYIENLRNTRSEKTTFRFNDFII